MALQVWLPLDGILENKGLDNLTFTHTTVASYEDGKIGKALQLNGTNVKFTVPSLVDANIFSVAFWYKAISDESITTNWNKVLTFTTTNADGTSGSYFRFESSYAISGYALSVHNNTSQSLGSIGHDIIADFGEWHHVCFTHTPEQNLTYLDGVLIRTGVGAEGTITGLVNIAGKVGGTDPNGLMNDLRIYDHCLSPKEVKELSKGLVAHYPLNDGVGNPNLLENTAFTDKNIRNTYWADEGTFGIYAENGELVIPYKAGNLRIYYNYNGYRIPEGNYVLSFDARADGITQLNAGRNNTGTYETVNVTKEKKHYSIQITGGSALCFGWHNGTATHTENVSVYLSNIKLENGTVETPWIPNPNDELYSAMGFDDCVVYDTSGYNHNAKWYSYDSSGSHNCSSDTPRYSCSTYIDSANNTTNTASGTVYLYGDCGLINPNQMTVAFWCKPIAGYTGGTTQGQFCTTNYDYGNDSAGSDYQASAMNHRDGRIDINDSSSTTQCKPAIDFTANEWHHYCVTYDGQTGRVYKDGVQTSNAQFNSAKTLDSFKGVIIGFSKAGGVWRSNKSYYSDFRIYATALSAEDIKELYETSASVDNYGNIYGHEVVE